MTDKVRVALCQYKRDNPQLSQKDLIKWLEDNHNIKISQATISTTLKRSAEILAKSDNENNFNTKRQRTVEYPEMESALVKWFRANQEWANVSGELIRKSATKILDRLYPGHEPFEFSNG
jgi:arginine repressor